MADDGLGVLSFTLTAVEAAQHRGLELSAVILVRRESGDTDPSRDTNAAILTERLSPVPILQLPHCADDDDALAEAAEVAGLPHLL